MAKASTRLAPRSKKTTEETRLARQEQRLAVEERRLAHTERLARIDAVYKLFRTALLGGAVVLCFYFITNAFREMAGKSTNLSAMIKAAIDLNVSQYASYAIAAAFGVAWGVERRTRRKTIMGHAEHIKQLESRLDPKRRSSGLLPDGQTKKEDKDA